MRWERRDTRRWAFAAAVVLVGYVASLGLAVDSPDELGGGQLSCGSPLMHGITFHTTFGGPGFWSAEDPWSSSPWCAAARTQRSAENLTIAVLVLMLVSTLVWLRGRRAAAVRSGEPTSVAGGVVAALLGPVAMLAGLLIARSRGTRRMLLVQLALCGAVVGFALVALLGATLSEHALVDQYVTWRLLASIIAGCAVLSLLPLVYPLTLIRRRTPE